jgi:hypothetical protein
MKNLLIKLSIATSLLVSFTASAEHLETSEINKPTVTVRVVAEAEPASFEVFSLGHAKAAIDETVDMMVSTVSDDDNASAAVTKASSSAI